MSRQRAIEYVKDLCFHEGDDVFASKTMEAKRYFNRLVG